jgi:hypothetical protein
MTAASARCESRRLDERPEAMAHRLADMYAWLMRRLAQSAPSSPLAHRMAHEAWRRMSEQNIDPAELQADDALVELGLAVRTHHGSVVYAPPEKRVLYFGVWRPGISGHHLYDAEGRTVSLAAVGLPISSAKLDSGLCPALEGESPAEREPEGLAAIHHIAGWTVLAFWDRSGDRRYGSHSTFVMEDTLAFEDAVALARAHYPRVWARFPFVVHLATLH